MIVRILDALLFAHQAVQPLIDLQERLRASNGKAKRPFTKPVTDETLAERVKQYAYERLAQAMQIKDKAKRRDTTSELHLEMRAALTAEGQPWAGKAWGSIAIPRIGQEVVVDFLEGDPDQPIVTGRVYNGELRPPYKLPLEATKTTTKSYSSKGGGGFNEIRFEDKKGSEQIFVHAERNQDNRVKNDSLEWVGNNRHLIVQGGRFEQVAGATHLTVKGDQNEKVDGTVSLHTGSDLQQKVGMNHALDAGMEIHLKEGLKVVIEAGAQLTLKVGGNFIDLNPAGVFIQGAMVLINSGGAAGSGSGSSPATPELPSEAEKAEPDE